MPTIGDPAAHITLLAPATQTKANFIAEVSTPIAASEPERRSRYLLVQVGSTKLAMIIEMLVLVLFLAAAGVAIINCFAELSLLLEHDTVGHVAGKAMSLKI